MLSVFISEVQVGHNTCLIAYKEGRDPFAEMLNDNAYDDEYNISNPSIFYSKDLNLSLMKLTVLNEVIISISI